MEPLGWRDGLPYSPRFDDIYFSRCCGVEETRHVFLAHNDLETRWRNLYPGAVFSIAETGFGTGLNFLCTWQLWRQAAPESACLHFFSTEKYPLSPADLEKVQALWPEFSALSGALLAGYAPSVSDSTLELPLDDGRVTLALLLGDARETLPLLLHDSVDAWFLDGFAPAKNPEMWQPELFATMAKLSAPGATFATYTCAGAVRRGLSAAGFAAEKVPGFGAKREMLRGAFTGDMTGRNRAASR